MSSSIPGGTADSPPATRRLVIVTQWFPPEQASFGQMMFELGTDLAARGWHVTVLTGFPNHPDGNVFGGYRKRWFMQEQIGPLRVWRVWLATSPNRSLFNRLLTFATFTLTSSWALLRHAEPGVIFAVLQPLSVAVTLPAIARLKKARLVFNVQDLHPDTQIRLGIVRNPMLIGLLRRLETFAYQSCDRLTVICEPFRGHVLKRGVLAAKVDVAENWIDCDAIVPAARDNSFRAEAGCGPEHFVALWAGTLGHVSGAAVLLDAAERLRADGTIRFVIVGDGPLRKPLSEEAERRQLTNVRFLPFQPRARLNDVQAIADVSLLTLGREFGELSVPSKVLAYMAAGRPIIAAVPEPSPTASLLRDAACGQIVPVADAVQLAAAIRDYAASPLQTEQLGKRARAYVELHYSRPAAAERYDEIFRKVAGA